MNYDEYMRLAEEGIAALMEKFPASAQTVEHMKNNAIAVSNLELLGRGFAILGAFPFAVAGYISRKVKKT